MALPKRPTSLKANAPNLTKVREWSAEQVANWMKDVNDGLFAKYVDNVIALKMNGVDLMNLTQNDMKIKLGITIPNHLTTLSAKIERLKKKSRRRNKSPNSPYKEYKDKKRDSVKILDDIPNYKKEKEKDLSSSLPTHQIQTKQTKQTKQIHSGHIGKSQSLMDIANENNNNNNNKLKRAYTVQPKKLNDDFKDNMNGRYPIKNRQHKANTVALKKVLTEQNLQNKKKDKYLYKDLGKKLWPNEMSKIIKEGWMKKRGVRRSGFKERWCVLLENGHLYYFEKRPTENSDLPQGMLDLDGVNKIEYVEDEDPNTFNIKTADRDWIFSVVSGGQLVEWMSALNKTLAIIHK